MASLVCTHARTRGCTRVHACAHTRARTHTVTHAVTRTHTHMVHALSLTHTYTTALTHMYIHNCTHTHVHTVTHTTKKNTHVHTPMHTCEGTSVLLSTLSYLHVGAVVCDPHHRTFICGYWIAPLPVCSVCGCVDEHLIGFLHLHQHSARKVFF